VTQTGRSRGRLRKGGGTGRRCRRRPAAGWTHEAALAFGVGEVEEDFVGSGGEAAAIDAVGDADIAVLGIAGGLRFQVMEDGEEGVEAGWAAGAGWGMHKKTLQFDV
jgi:hypothetical protein